jgi:aspartate kinase
MLEGKLLSTITAEIIPGYLQSHNVAVICSARSGTSKLRGTTSLLLEAIHLATSSSTDTTAIDEVIDIIQLEHVQSAREAIGADTDISRDVQTCIEQDCEQLRTLLKATWTLGEISSRIQDRVLAVGETLSCRIVAGSLRMKV